MLYVACEVASKSGGRVDEVKVVSVHREGHLARKSADNNAKTAQGDMLALPLSMARPGSVRPKRGDVLPVMSEASGLVAVALVK